MVFHMQELMLSSCCGLYLAVPQSLTGGFGQVFGSWVRDTPQWISVLTSLELKAMLGGEAWSEEVGLWGHGTEGSVLPCSFGLALLPTTMPWAVPPLPGPFALPPCLGVC